MSSTALPGQRAAQRPLRAAIAAQAALGRAASRADSMASHVVLNIGGRWMQQTWTPDGERQLTPYVLGHEQEG
ncbi:hypothetical protein [Streptomyces sp. NPDC058045]|uniref:hypothetical protein n=1 Tax=Streptomyces sp. NPDC058045 TaxID=3346311 RepID=UPI0036EF44C1